MEPSSEAKVADLELAVGVDEKVARFEVAVKDTRRVDVLYAEIRCIQIGSDDGAP